MSLQDAPENRHLPTSSVFTGCPPGFLRIMNSAEASFIHQHQGVVFFFDGMFASMDVIEVEDDNGLATDLGAKEKVEAAVRAVLDVQTQKWRRRALGGIDKLVVTMPSRFSSPSLTDPLTYKRHFVATHAGEWPDECCNRLAVMRERARIGLDDAVDRPHESRVIMLFVGLARPKATSARQATIFQGDVHVTLRSDRRMSTPQTRTTKCSLTLREAPLRLVMRFEHPTWFCNDIHALNGDVFMDVVSSCEEARVIVSQVRINKVKYMEHMTVFAPQDPGPNKHFRTSYAMDKGVIHCLGTVVIPLEAPPASMSANYRSTEYVRWRSFFDAHCASYEAMRAQAASCIQRQWRLSVSDPAHAVCRLRLLREFKNMS